MAPARPSEEAAQPKPVTHCFQGIFSEMLPIIASVQHRPAKSEGSQARGAFARALWDIGGTARNTCVGRSEGPDHCPARSMLLTVPVYKRCGNYSNISATQTPKALDLAADLARDLTNPDDKAAARDAYKARKMGRAKAQ